VLQATSLAELNEQNRGGVYQPRIVAHNYNLEFRGITMPPIQVAVDKAIRKLVHGV
jgi:hypothetical protein